MRITALAVAAATRGWPGLRCGTLGSGLNVFHGPTGSGKTMLADLLAHALLGKRLLASRGAEPPPAAEGELLVETGGRGYRLRRSVDGNGKARLTVAARDGSAVGQDTVRQFLGGLSPALAGPIYARSVRQEPLEQLLSEDFLQRLVALGQGEGGLGTTSHKAELVAQRDELARALEMRIAGERLESRALDERWRQLDRLVQDSEQRVGERRERLRALLASLAEVDTRLRYLELEATLGQHVPSSESAGWELAVLELDERIAQWRLMLSKLQQREAATRSELAQVQPDDEAPAVTLADQRAWLTLAQRWAADLEGEVARLARATASQTCVCRDAHPRLQPIVETIADQLRILAGLVDQQQRAADAVELGQEADDLARSQAALQRQVEHLLERRQVLVRSTRPGRRPIARPNEPGPRDDRWRDMHQLDQRRWQLQKEQAEALEELATLEPRLRDLRGERDAVDRQRAALLSVQSIDDLRGQLAAVQRQLATASDAPAENPASQVLVEASDTLAQLTNGGLVGIQLPRQEGPQVVDRDGALVPLASLPVGQRHLVQLGICLACASLCQGRGVRLPLVLDEPFADLSAAEANALAAVLDDVGRRGQQVLVFTGHQAAVERFAALGVAAQAMRHLQLAADADAVLVEKSAASRQNKPNRPSNGQSVRGPRTASGKSAVANSQRGKRKRKSGDK